MEGGPPGPALEFLHFGVTKNMQMWGRLLTGGRLLIGPMPLGFSVTVAQTHRSAAPRLISVRSRRIADHIERNSGWESSAGHAGKTSAIGLSIGQPPRSIPSCPTSRQRFHFYQQNGLNLSVCVHKAGGAVVGQLGKLRPIVNRPTVAFAPESGGSQPPRRIPSCPSSRQRFHFYGAHPRTLLPAIRLLLNP
jgi:hypothetical protein